MILKAVSLLTKIFIPVVILMSTGFADEMTPAGILDRLDKIYENIDDYQCRMEEWCSNGQKYEKRSMYYFFKKPLMIRTDIINGNKAMDRGSVAVYTGGAKVTGRKGGILSGISIEIDKNNPMATTVRGLTIDDADMKSIIAKLRYYFNNGNYSAVRLTNNIYQLTGSINDPSKNKGLSSEVILLDSETLLPVQADGYENGSLVQHSVWSEYILNAGLPDELFKINFDLNKLKKSGIKTSKEN